jgi:hypothetical protein
LLDRRALGYLRSMSHLHRHATGAQRAPRSVLVLLALVALLVAGACSEDKKLKVTGLEPTKGDFNGGQLVRIAGNGFTQNGALNAKVYFGDRQGTVVRFDGDTGLIVQAPGGDVGQTVDVLILFEGPGAGEARLPKAFTFVEPGTGADIEDLDTSQVKKK